MANQEDTDPPLAVQQARGMFKPMHGRDIKESLSGGVVVTFGSTWPFPLAGNVHRTYSSVSLPPYDLYGQYGDTDTLVENIEVRAERLLLERVLPALETRATELGIDSEARKLASIQETIDRSLWLSEESRWLVDVLNRILHG